MSFLIFAAYLAGVVVFATLLRSSRAFFPGLVGFALGLVPFLVQAVRPELVSADSWWVLLFRLSDVLTLAGDVLVLGAVYALRDNPSPNWERRLARAAGVLVMAGLAFASLVPTWFHFGVNAALAVIGLLSVVGMLARWGTAQVGLLGAGGFGLLALTALASCAGRLLPDLQQGLPGEALPALETLGLLAVIGAFALASQDASARQESEYFQPVGSNSPRWVGLVLLGLGAVVFLGLGYALGELHILQGVRGRAALLAALLPASGLYLGLLGVARVTTGRPVWSLRQV